MNTEKLVAIAGTYLRAAIAAVLALYLAGESNPKNLLMAAIASVAAPILKALDPTEAAYGRGSE
jgi:hypothetical protein